MKRTRVETKKVYLAFLNEWLEHVEYGIPVTATKLVKKYGISSNFATYVQRAGFFTNVSNSKKTPIWETNHKTPFTEKEVESIINGFTYYKKTQKAQKERELVPVILNNNDKSSEEILTKISTDALIKELRKRGYSGELHYLSKIII
jgi:hypothetical protein